MCRNFGKVTSAIIQHVIETVLGVITHSESFVLPESYKWKIPSVKLGFQ